LFISDSSNFPKHDKSDIGLYDATEVKSLAGLGIGTIKANFHMLGIEAELRLWLKILTSHLL
jgi:hypothetical protein